MSKSGNSNFTPFNNRDEYFMTEALKEAQKAFDKDEVPIGVVIVENNKIIARAHNLVETLNDSTAHAEMIAMTSAFSLRNTKYLPNCTIYSTLEPCIMCAYATNLAKIKNINFGAEDLKNGFSTFHTNILHPKATIIRNILNNKSKKLLKNFFIKKRI